MSSSIIVAFILLVLISFIIDYLARNARAVKLKQAKFKAFLDYCDRLSIKRVDPDCFDIVFHMEPKAKIRFECFDLGGKSYLDSFIPQADGKEVLESYYGLDLPFNWVEVLLSKLFSKTNESEYKDFEGIWNFLQRCKTWEEREIKEDE